jgi:hypothetical protein
MLRAAYSAPSRVIAELERSAELKPFSESVMRNDIDCVCLLTLNMRMSIETAARTPMQKRKVLAESDFGLGLNLGIKSNGFSVLRIRRLRIIVETAAGGRNRNGGLTRNSDSQINHFQFFNVKTNKGV